MSSIKPYFTHGVNFTNSDRDLITSTTKYSGMHKRYFSSLDAEIFIGEERLLDIVRIDFSYEEKKLPYYGFNSYWPSRIFTGQKIIQGTFAINFTEPGYIAKLLQNVDRSKMQEDSELIGKTCSVENSPLFGKAFDILVSYGGYKLEEHRSYNSNFQIIEGVYINGYSQILDISGEPIMEVYSFIAKNLKFGDYDYNKNQYSNNNNYSSEADDSNTVDTKAVVDIVEDRLSSDKVELKNRCDKNNKLLGIVVDVNNALHNRNDGATSHIYVDFKEFYNGNNTTYINGNIDLVIHDNEVELSETFTLVRKNGNIFGVVLNEDYTKLIKKKLTGKTQQLVSCTIKGSIMHNSTKIPFNEKVFIRKGVNY